MIIQQIHIYITTTISPKTCIVQGKSHHKSFKLIAGYPYIRKFCRRNRPITKVIWQNTFSADLTLYPCVFCNSKAEPSYPLNTLFSQNVVGPQLPEVLSAQMTKNIYKKIIIINNYKMDKCTFYMIWVCFKIYHKYLSSVKI